MWLFCILSVHAICTIFLSIACNLFHTHQMFSSCRLSWTLNRRKASVKHMFTSNCVNLASIKWTAFVFFIWFYPQMGTDTRNGDWVNYGFGWTVQRCEADFGDPSLQGKWLLYEWEQGLLELLLWKLFSWMWTISNTWQTLYFKNIFCNLITWLSQLVFYRRIFT